MERIAQDMAGIRAGWEGMLGRVRAGSSLELMLNEMQALPVFSVETMVRATGRTKQAVGLAVSRLLEAGIIRQTNQGKRSRVFEAPDVLEEFAIVERRLASPARDTSVEPNEASLEAIRETEEIFADNGGGRFGSVEELVQELES